MLLLSLAFSHHFCARSNNRDPILSFADSAAFRLISKRTLFSSSKKQIIPPASRKPAVSPTVKTGASCKSATSTGNAFTLRLA